MGQNFLISGPVAEKIEQVAQLKDGCYVVEIGPGLGALSEGLAQRAASLCLLELDGRLCLHLQRLFAKDTQVEVVNADALSFDYAGYAADNGWGEYQVVANLPYFITSPLIRYLLLEGGPWQCLTLMVQREVAEKLTQHHDGEGGPLALLLQYFGSARLAFTVPPECFYPEPEVTSAVLHVERWTKPPFTLDDPLQFETFLIAAFNQRRKTLVNSLSNTLGGGKELWLSALKACGIAENRRAEQLTLHEFGALFALPQVRELLK